MASELNLSIAKRFFNECWNQGKVDLLDEIMAPDNVHHLPDSELNGFDEVKDGIRNLLMAFPDMSITIDDEIVAQDKVVSVG